ncbi:MAG: hypothetical protein LC131_15025 [Anaerolineae bacterium]|nr:hypothetical protein [Anaerolineae bacterium]
MLRRTQPQPVETIEMLREKHLKKYTEVYAVDGERLGMAMRLVHRPIEDVNIEQKLYRSYLIFQSILLGGTNFVPTLFIESYEPEANRLTLSVDLKTIQDETWNREPLFVAVGRGVYEELAD